MGRAFDPAVAKPAVELHEKGELALPSTPNPGLTPSDLLDEPSELLDEETSRR